MNNIKNWEKTMTVFFSKNTGKIKAVCQGVQNFNYFGDDKKDMEIILEKMEVPFNNQILYNQHLFIIKDKVIKLKGGILDDYR